MVIRRLYAILSKMLSLTSLFPPAPEFIWLLASTAKSLSSQGHVGKAILCGGIKCCYISPISPPWQSKLGCKPSLALPHSDKQRNIDVEHWKIFIHVEYDASLVYFSPHHRFDMIKPNMWHWKANSISVAETAWEIKAEISYLKLKTKALFT